MTHVIKPVIYSGLKALATQLLLLLPLSLIAASPDCNFPDKQLAIGEEKDFFLCGKDLPTVITLDATDISLIYSQPLKKCGVDDKRPGFHLVFSATGNTGQTRLNLSDKTTGQTLCQSELLITAPINKPAKPFTLNADSAKFIDVKGINTRYFDYGSGPALLLVHGGNAGGSNNNAMKWEQNIPGLAQHFRVIVLDRLAQAGTDNLPNSDDYKQYFSKDAQHLQDFVEVLGIKSITAVGHSQGGWPVTRLALDKPDTVSCLVNIDTLMVPNDLKLMKDALKFLLYVSRNLHPETGPTLYSARRGMALRYPSGNGISMTKAQRVVDQYQSSKTRQAKEAMKAHRISPVHKSFQTLKQQAYDDIQAGKLTAKSLVVWGEKDPQVPLGLGMKFQQILVENNVDSVLEIIPGAGHAPFIEFPERFNQLVINYCR